MAPVPGTTTRESVTVVSDSAKDGSKVTTGATAVSVETSTSASDEVFTIVVVVASSVVEDELPSPSELHAPTRSAARARAEPASTKRRRREGGDV